MVMWSLERSGAMKAPKTRVGEFSGIGGIGIALPSESKACNVVTGGSRV